MKHYTCDKCDKPMDKQKTMRINSWDYDICEECARAISKGLEHKGTLVFSEDKQIFDTLNKQPNKFADQRSDCVSEKYI